MCFNNLHPEVPGEQGVIGSSMGLPCMLVKDTGLAPLQEGVVVTEASPEAAETRFTPVLGFLSLCLTGDTGDLVSNGLGPEFRTCFCWGRGS